MTNDSDDARAAQTTTPQPAGAERVRAVLAEWFSDAEGMCRAYEGDLPDKAEIYVVAAKRSRLYLGTYGELRRAALGSGEGTAGADRHRTEVEARRDNAEIQSLREVCMLQARELKKLDPHGSTPADLDEAMNRLRGVLSAPHHQSPSLPEVDADAVLNDLHLTRAHAAGIRAADWRKFDHDQSLAIRMKYLPAALATLTASREQDGEVRT